MNTIIELIRLTYLKSILQKLQILKSFKGRHLNMRMDQHLHESVPMELGVKVSLPVFLLLA